MSNSIDTKVVEMKFDNAQFARGVASTLKDLALLKSGLKLDGAAKGLEHLNTTASKFNLGGITNGVSAIASKFSALGIVGVTALAGIATQALATGAQMAKGLTLEPIMAGFSEYELKLGSIQTILANTAKDNTTLAQVTASLDELNHYADKTIYNFGEMTKNIGLFTNAGIGIKDATSIIKGFSNEAAASGTSAEGAAGAAYQLSQALSAGKITLMDWRSLQNVGMGNANMKRGILDIADAMGTLKKQGVSSKDVQKDFNGTLEKGWLTADVMSKYLRIMAGDMSEAEMKSIGLSKAQIASFAKQQKTAEDAATKVRTFTQLLGTLKEATGSGWSATFESLFGNFDEATVLFTNVNNVLGALVNNSANARNKLIGDWKALGGRTVLIDGIAIAFNNVMDILTPIKKAFRDIFPAATGKQLYDLTVGFRNLMANMRLNEGTMDNLRRTFRGLFAIVSIGISILKGIATVIATVFKSFSGGSGGILEFTGNIGDWLVALDKAIKKGEGFHNFFVGLGHAITLPIQFIKSFVGFISDLVKGMGKLDGSAVGNKLKERFAPLGKIGEQVGKSWSRMTDILQKVFKIFEPLAEKFTGFFEGLGESVSKGFADINYNGLLDGVNTGLLAGLVLLFKKFLSGGINIDLGGGVLGTIKESFEGLTGVMSAMQAQLKANALIKIAGAIALLTVSVVALSLIDSKKLASALSGLTVMFTQLLVSMAIMDRISSTTGFLKLPGLAITMIGLAIAIDLLAVAVGKMAALSWEEMARGLTGTAVLLASLALFTKFSGSNVGGGLSLILLAGAINILVKAVKDMAELSWGQIAKGLIGTATLLGALALFTKFSAANKGGLTQGAGLLLLAYAIKVLAEGMEDLGKLSWGEIAKGLVVMAGGLLLMGKALAAVPPSSIFSAAAIFVVALSLSKIGDAMKKMGGLSWTEIAKGLIVMGQALSAIALALDLLPPTALLSAAAIFVTAVSLGLIADALDNMGSMSWVEIAKSLIVLAGSLAILAGALYLMEAALPGAAALVVAAFALQKLVPALQGIGELSWKEILDGLAKLAVVLGVLGLAGSVMGILSPLFVLLGIAIGVMGVGMLAAGAGMALFGIGLSLVAASGAAAVGVLIGSVRSILNFLPEIATKLGAFIVAFANAVTKASPAVVRAIVTVLLNLLGAIDKLAPKIISTLGNLLLRMLAAMVKYVPKMADAGTKMIIGVLNAIAKNVGKMVTAGTNVAVNFLNGVAKNLPRIIQAGVNLIISFVNGLATAIRNNSSAMGEAGGNLASAIVEGMVRGIGAGIGSVVKAAKNLAQSALDAAKAKLGIKSPSKEFTEVGKFSSMGLANGLVVYKKVVVKAAENVGNSAIESLRASMSGISDIVTTDANFNPIIRPVLDLTDVKKVASQINPMLSAKPLAVATTAAKAKDASNGYSANQAAQQTADSDASTSFEFTQINNSPKALSNAEIYRKTNNQLSVVKGALKKK